MLLGLSEKYLKKSFLLFLFVFILLINIKISFANESQNKTLTDVQIYNFSAGSYNLVKVAENEKSGYEILFETELPYINFTYTAQSNGYLDVYLHPLQGSYPLVELSEGWEVKPTTYSKNMIKNETVFLTIFPPLFIKSYNTSQIQEGYMTIWELYTWPDLFGSINSTFLVSENVSFEIMYYPSNPRQGDKISLFSESNENIHNISWSISGKDFYWYNESDVLEISELKAGEYSVNLKGYDTFKQSHTANTILSVMPPIIEATNFDIALFSLNYPESVYLGDNIIITATIDFSTSSVMIVKYLISDTTSGEKYDENIFNLTGSGTKTLTYQFMANKTEKIPFNLQLFYYDGEKWVELDKSQKEFNILINEPDKSHEIPGFYTISIVLGMSLSFVFISMNKKYN